MNASRLAGGLVGLNNGTLTDDGASETVTGPNEAGGLVGFNGMTISTSSTPPAR